MADDSDIVLAELESAGFSLRMDGPKLIVAPASKLTADQCRDIAAHKVGLVASLRRRDGWLRVVVAGSRTITDAGVVAKAVEASGFRVAEVVCGEAAGVDAAGRKWAEANGVAVKSCQAAWDRHGKAAGPIRNREMAEYADALVLVWDGKSPGSANMLAEARARGLKVFEVVLEGDRSPFAPAAAGCSTANSGAGGATTGGAPAAGGTPPAPSSNSVRPAVYSAWVRTSRKEKWTRVAAGPADDLALMELVHERTRTLPHCDVLVRPDSYGDPNKGRARR